LYFATVPPFISLYINFASFAISPLKFPFLLLFTS